MSSWVPPPPPETDRPGKWVPPPPEAKAPDKWVPPPPPGTSRPATEAVRAKFPPAPQPTPSLGGGSDFTDDAVANRRAMANAGAAAQRMGNAMIGFLTSRPVLYVAGGLIALTVLDAAWNYADDHWLDVTPSSAQAEAYVRTLFAPPTLPADLAARVKVGSVTIESTAEGPGHAQSKATISVQPSDTLYVPASLDDALAGTADKGPSWPSLLEENGCLPSEFRLPLPSNEAIFLQAKLKPGDALPMELHLAGVRGPKRHWSLSVVESPFAIAKGVQNFVGTARLRSEFAAGAVDVAGPDGQAAVQKVLKDRADFAAALPAQEAKSAAAQKQLEAQQQQALDALLALVPRGSVFRGMASDSRTPAQRELALVFSEQTTDHVKLRVMSTDQDHFSQDFTAAVDKSKMIPGAPPALDFTPIHVQNYANAPRIFWAPCTLHVELHDQEAEATVQLGTNDRMSMTAQRLPDAEAGSFYEDPKHRHDRVMAATQAGAVYIGVLSHDQQAQALSLQVLEQTGDLISMRLATPDNRRCQRTFSGIFNEDSDDPTIDLVVGPGQGTNDGRDWIPYRADGSFKLKFNGDRIEGVGIFMGQPYMLTVSKAAAEAPTAVAGSAAPPLGIDANATPASIAAGMPPPDSSGATPAPPPGSPTPPSSPPLGSPPDASPPPPPVAQELPEMVPLDLLEASRAGQYNIPLPPRFAQLFGGKKVRFTGEVGRVNLKERLLVFRGGQSNGLNWDVQASMPAGSHRSLESYIGRTITITARITQLYCPPFAGYSLRVQILDFE